MITRIKVMCSERVERSGGVWNLKFAAVTNGSKENAEFWRWTPTGNLEFSCVNINVVPRFEVGKEYYLDISNAQETISKDS